MTVSEGDRLDAFPAGVTAGTVRDGVLDEPDSRAATDELLSTLRTSRYTPTAWSRFLARATRRSVRQALHHRRALLESTVLHAGLAALADPRHRTWVAASWLLTISHLGMLENRRTLGVANTLTLIRANLPALENRLGNAVPILALTTDWLDGRISRETGTETRFGRQADFLADTALWTWFTLRHEPNGWLRTATFAAWGASVVAVTVASFAGGAMKDMPRSRRIRPAATLQVIIGLRIVLRQIRHTRRELHGEAFPA
ncbi:CDP-alcohol phosphatidyltransferase family protein [Arthrobacter roseus]|uniref:CDP-alcohol phosphatidyltransferase family protein n=1 Tax=Arthrobacter roseus TaxID=136274 RepID=UPI001964ADFF|nr:CDP-alcohol phosphatidyltransferase family protein [Arthrobacter roseus]MBM7847338.1 phosphatidylglycerophosphate synthase [Arthrobacter roseus]